MPNTSRRIRLVPDDATGLDSLEVVPDSRDMYALRDMVEQRKWPEDMRIDPVRQSYALAWLCARRLDLIDPGVKFGDFVPLYALEVDDTALEVDPTNPAPWAG